jgi:hypothetical protein
MRRSAMVLTIAVIMLVPEAVVHAQSRATYSACEALSEQRASGPGPSDRTHNAFMRDCLAGKIPFAEGRTVVAASERQVQSLERCEALAEQRGAGAAGGSGNRNHRSFIRQCMAGKIR